VHQSRWLQSMVRPLGREVLAGQGLHFVVGFRESRLRRRGANGFASFML
jgi:hypothetical protein